MMFLILIIILLVGCGRNSAEKEIREMPIVMDNIENPTDDSVADLSDQAENGHKLGDEDPQSEEHTALEQFGTYLEYILKEGDWQELEQYIISEPLTWDEAAEMAELSPAFTHFSSYRDYWFDSHGAVLLRADVNGDGFRDIIEYLPDVGTNANSHYPRQYSLTIYTSDADRQYSVMYFQPYFATAVSSDAHIFVLQYDRETYLVFQRTDLTVQRVTAYLIRDDALAGRIVLNYECPDAAVEVTYCTSGMEEEAEELCENAMWYYRDFTGDLMEGDAEIPVREEQEEYDMLIRIAVEEESEYEKKYQEQSGLTGLFITTIAGYGDYMMEQSDLDNDGRPEWYAKAIGTLGMINRANMLVYPTGELYGDGKHEGEWGLKYNMVSQGRRTDFEQLCGLDIWSSDDIPQAFWVEQCGGENITFIKYYDKNYFTCLIEGYCIRNGSYETVLSVCYRPVVSCDPVYEWHIASEREEALTYTVHLPVGREIQYPYPVLYGLQDEEVQSKINDAMAELLQERIDSRLEDMEVVNNPFLPRVSCNVLSAQKEQLVLKYILYDDHTLSGSVCLEADLENGDVRIFDFYGSDYDCRGMVEQTW